MLARLSRMNRNEEGFTLIELLVVVAIIALLTAFAVPKLFDAINKSKDARGQGDMETIPGALDRFYFDNNAFPDGATAAAVKAQVMPAYLKSSTRYVNGYNKGYIYINNAAGDYYIVVDPKNLAVASTVTVSCGTTTPHTQNATVGTDLTVVQAATILPGDVREGCSITAPAGGLPFVTN
ncbi:MAG TPA: prepilin-type N-terminal cleavage/methylation domain-containing protein [Symbiobacteriaceae bacterium]